TAARIFLLSSLSVQHNLVNLSIFSFFLPTPPPPRFTLFPYTTLFRSLQYFYSNAPGGSAVAVNIPGVGFTGREPYSYIQRTEQRDRKSTRLNSSHEWISYAVFCLKKKNDKTRTTKPTDRQRHTLPRIP